MGFIFFGNFAHPLDISAGVENCEITRKLPWVVCVDEQRNFFSNLVFDNFAFSLNEVVANHPNGPIGLNIPKMNENHSF